MTNTKSSRFPIRRRRRSTGSVTFHKATGLWMFRYWVGDRRQTGYASDRKTAESKLARELVFVADGITQTERVTLADWASYWLESKQVAESTRVGYKIHLRHATTRLGNLKLDKLRAFDLETLYSELLESGLSSTSVNAVHRTVRNCLGAAVRRDLMRKNIAADAEAPRPLSRKPIILSRRQWSELIASSRQDPNGLLVELLLKTGLRVDSEALNLRWEDVDLSAHRFSVRESKTRAGRGRVIPFDPELARLLRHQRARYEESRLKNGPDWNNQNLVFYNEAGNRMSLSNLRKRMFMRIKQLAGVPESLRFHDLRHNCGSLLLSEGVPITTVSRILGHANVSITLSVYAHQLPEDMDTVADVMASIHRVG
jgi:integrase